MGKGIGGHQEPNKGATDEWLTPPWILERLGDFDLDPSAPISRVFETAKSYFTLRDGGLTKPWFGRVFLNPPYGPQTGKWLSKLVDHGNGIALIFARTETEMFHRYVWEKATGLLFLEGRLFFHHVNGKRANSNAGGPSVLIAYGLLNSKRLEKSQIKGSFVRLR